MKASKFSIVWDMNENSDVFNKLYEINSDIYWKKNNTFLSTL